MPPRPITTPRCNHCRRKKIKCDYQLPRCGPCIRSNIDCVPYKNELVIIHQAPKKKRRESTASSTREPDLKYLPHPSPYFHHQARQASLPSAHALAHHPFIGRGFKLHNTIVEFASYYATSGSKEYEGLCMSWIEELNNCKNLSSAIEQGATALTLMVRGKQAHDDRMLANSMTMYGNAVSCLRSEITRNAERYWVATLTATMVLLEYETMYPSGPTMQGYLGYVTGISAILRMVGPKELQPPKRHGLFLHCRTLLIILSAVMRTPCFLSSPTWMKVPFEQVPKADFDQCIDLMSGIALVGQAANRLLLIKEGEEVPIKQLAAFKHLWLATDNEQTTWYDSYVARNGVRYSARYGPVDTSTTYQQAHKPKKEEYDKYYVFNNLREAGCVLGYWTAKVLMSDSLMELAASPNAALAQQVGDMAAQHTPQWIEMADNLLRSLSYCLQKDNGVVGIQFVALPLQVCTRLFQRLGMGGRLARCQEFTDNLADKEFNFIRTRIVQGYEACRSRKDCDQREPAREY